MINKKNITLNEEIKVIEELKKVLRELVEQQKLEKKGNHAN